MDIIDNRIEKHLNFNTSSYIKQRLAKVIEVDTDSQKIYVYFVDDENQTQYVYYNKTNEIITSGDNVKVFYTSDIIKGWIGERCGEPNIANIESATLDTSPLTEYQYLTDDSVKCNGVTYTAEKDAETGLISSISDSNGNSLKPEIPSGITNVALHNAVFWAVAMARGLGSPDPAEELIKSAIYRLYEPDGTIYMTNYVDTGIPQSRLTSSETGVTVAFVLKPSAWAPYYGLWGQHSGNDGQNIQCTKSSGANSAHLYRHNIGFDLTAGEKYVLIISDQRNTADCYVMKNTVEITKGTPSDDTSSAFGNVVLYNSYQFLEQRNYHGIAYDALIWDKALTRSEALAVAKRLMAQHNITGGNT